MYSPGLKKRVKLIDRLVVGKRGRSLYLLILLFFIFTSSPICPISLKPLFSPIYSS
jgi:hypothetical protein